LEVQGLPGRSILPSLYTIPARVDGNTRELVEVVVAVGVAFDVALRALASLAWGVEMSWVELSLSWSGVALFFGFLF
jgi:hypothetical protein